MIKPALALVALATPAPALDFGQLAEVLCIDPFEAVMPPDATGLDPVEPAPRFILTGDRVFAVGEAYLVLSGDFETEESRCELYARLDQVEANAARSWFQAWITAGIDAGRYGPEDAVADVYESTDWREPRMLVGFVVSEGIARLRVEDTDKEA